MELSIGCVRRLTDAFANRTTKVDFSIQTTVDMALFLLAHDLGLDHHAALLIFCPNLLNSQKLNVSSNSANDAKLTTQVKYAQIDM